MTWLPERLPSSVASFSRRQLPVCSLITKARMFPVGCRKERTGNSPPSSTFPALKDAPSQSKNSLKYSLRSLPNGVRNKFAHLCSRAEQDDGGGGNM